MYKKKPLRRKKTSPKVRVSNAQTQSMIKRIVRRTIAGTTENKTKQAYNFSYPLYPSNHTNFPLNVIQLGPNSTTCSVAQGTGAGARIGNQIRTKKLVFKGTILPMPQDGTTNPNPRPFQVKMVIFYDKKQPTTTPAIASNFFQDGNSDRGFNSSIVDMWSPYNTDRYRIVKSKTFKIGFSQNAGTATSAVNQGQWQAYSNNDFKMNCNFNVNVTKYFPKIVKFDDSSLDATSRSLYAVFYMAGAGGEVSISTWVPIQVQWMMDYVYEDA